MSHITNACNYINTEFPYTVSDSESIFDQTPDICSNTMNLVVCPDVTQISVPSTASTSSIFFDSETTMTSETTMSSTIDGMSFIMIYTYAIIHFMSNINL